MNRVLLDGAVLSVLATLLIAASSRANPRLWLQDLPRDIRDAVPPKSAAERRESWQWGLPLFGVLLGVPAFSAVQWLRESQGAVSFLALWWHTFGVMFVFNVVDLVVIDWVVLCWITPAWAVIPGTAGLPGYKNYGHHFRGFLIGNAACLFAALLVATGVWLMRAVLVG